MSIRRISTFAFLAIFVAMFVAVLLLSDPPATLLPRVYGAAYKVSLTKYSDGEGLVCQPFKLDITYDRQPDFRRHLLVAEQADDIIVAQTPTVMYVFYHDLALTDFAGFSYDSRDAKPLLCDVDIPVCAAEKDRLAKAGAKMHRICGRVRQ